MHLPEGDHIRNDAALYQGFESGIHYDSMAAKLIVWGENRTEAIDRTIAALDEYHLAGFNTTIPFCRFTLNSEPFRSGHYSTAFVAEQWRNQVPEHLQVLLAASAAYAHAQGLERRVPVWQSTSTWVTSSR